MSWDLNRSNTHIIPFEFEYHEPKSLDEAVELLKKLGSEAKVLAGGTDLLIQMKMGVLRPKHIINLKKINGLNLIVDKGEYLSIGALTKLRDIEKNEIIKSRFPALYQAVKSMASIQIKNMATIGGNLCNASPAADTAPPLMVYNAKLKIYGSKGYRVIPIEKFFKGPKQTILENDEILVEIMVPYPKPYTGSFFIKIARTSMDLAKANVATKIVLNENDVIEEIAVALGSVAPTPIRAKTVESYLLNKRFEEKTVYKASKLVLKDIKPITDARSTAEYRRYVSQAIVYDALINSYKMIRGEKK